MKIRSGLVVAAGLCAAGCFSTHADPEPACADVDGDGYGDGPGCRGADCDDADRARHEDCTPPPPPPDCENGAFEHCYEGPEGTLGVGLCASGARTCRDGTWSDCEDAVPPVDEVCDGLDQDCDGAVDDGVLRECGGCDPLCHEACLGVDCNIPFAPGENAALDAAGALVAATAGDIAPRRIWVPESSPGAVYEVRTDTFEVLRGVLVPDDGDRYHWPGTILLDQRGNAFVGTSNGGGGVTRIDAGDCPDRDGDGLVRTSAGRDDILERGTDECIAWTADLGRCPSCDLQRPMVLTEDGNKLWGSGEPDLVEVDTATGDRTGREVTFVQGHAEAMIAFGDELWASAGELLYRIPLDDVEDLETIDIGGPFRDLKLEATHDALLTWPPLGRVDLQTEECDDFEHRVDNVVTDAAGDVWLFEGQHELVRFDPAAASFEPIVVETFPADFVADLDGQLWTLGYREELTVYATPTLEHRATVLDDCVRQPDQTSGCLGYGRLLGDPTGLRLRRAYPGSVERAVSSFVFEGACEGADPEWTELAWELDGAASSVLFEARSAATPEGLGTSPWIQVATGEVSATGVSLAAVPAGRLLELRMWLRGAAPVLRSVRVRHHC